MRKFYQRLKDPDSCERLIAEGNVVIEEEIEYDHKGLTATARRANQDANELRPTTNKLFNAIPWPRRVIALI